METGRQTSYTSRSTSLTLSDLHPYYQYTYIIAAYTIRVGPYSGAITLRMPEDGELVNSILSIMHYARTFVYIREHISYSFHFVAAHKACIPLRSDVSVYYGNVVIHNDGATGNRK